jgi:hypothetical protein
VTASVNGGRRVLMLRHMHRGYDDAPLSLHGWAKRPSGEMKNSFLRVTRATPT